MALLIIKKVILVVEYEDFAKLFSKNLAKVPPKQTGINKYAMKPKNNK